MLRIDAHQHFWRLADRKAGSFECRLNSSRVAVSGTSIPNAVSSHARGIVSPCLNDRAASATASRQTFLGSAVITGRPPR